MGKESPILPPVRASDMERERTARVLRDHSAEGQLSPDTFARRVDHALRAESQDELAELVSDLPPRRRISRWLIDAASALSAFSARLEAAWRVPRLPQLVLPQGCRLLVIGRDPGCDLVLPDPTVSRRHAELRRFDGQWLLADLHSTNGTRLNGWRQAGLAYVRSGDQVAFGQAHFRVCVR